MTLRLLYNTAMVVLLIGSTTLLFSCKSPENVENTHLETMITHQTDNLKMINSVNGVLKYKFETPLLERYELARDPYMEFRQGLNLINYDSLGKVASTLVADYAIYYEKRELWEARGNVVALSSDGRELYTEQLSWDEKTGRIYSNVDSKIVDGHDILVGEGFESDVEFKFWEFRNSESQLWVDASPGEETKEDEIDKTKQQSDKQQVSVLPKEEVPTKLQTMERPMLNSKKEKKRTNFDSHKKIKND